ncbi:MAG TPA: hypothetical protein VM557_14740 [Thermoanaerobaculia bacterium]|nr:hypothetical protein [Thermoanaerobaculia bacterium]
MKILAVVILFIIGGERAAASEFRVAPASLREKGVQGYVLHSAGSSEIVLDVLDEPGHTTMTLEVAINRDRTKLEMRYVRPGEAVVAIEWNPLEELLTIQSGHDLLEIRFDREKLSWTRSGSELLYSRTAEAIQICGAIVVDLFERNVLGDEPVSRIPERLSAGRGEHGRERIVDRNSAPAPVAEGEVEARLSSHCFGPEVRGFATDLSESLACRDAKADANLQCWNSYCTGCCHFYECDSICALGDYFCSGAITGVACSDYPPPPIVECLESPIIIDIHSGQYRLTSLDDGVSFDIDGDGALDRVSWITGSTGLLVMDRNLNGVIDSGQELFGSATLLASGEKAENGFVALGELDTMAMVL